MTTSIEKQLDRIAKRYQQNFKEVNRAINSVAFSQEIAEVGAELIKKRTRLGYGVASQGGERFRLKPLMSQQYIDFRKRFSGLSEFTTYKRSNLTLTGQLLDSIRGRGTRDGIVIYLLSKRTDQKSRKYNITNGDVKDFQEKQGRPFFYFSRTENNNIERLYRQKIFKELKSRRILVR